MEFQKHNDRFPVFDGAAFLQRSVRPGCIRFDRPLSTGRARNANA